MENSQDTFLACSLEFPAWCHHDRQLHLHVHRQVIITVIINSQNHLHYFHFSKFISTSDDGHMRAFCCGNAVTGDVTDKAKLNIHWPGIGDVVVYKPPGRSQ